MADRATAYRIRELILSGSLAPGSRVTEEAVASILGVSRTPVRNALPEVAAEGLLVRVGRRGYAVPRFSADESWRALEFRAVLEGYAARAIATEGAPASLVAALRERLEEGDTIFASGTLSVDDEAAYGRMNAEFHRLVVDACGIPMLRDAVARLNSIPFVAPSVIVFDRVGLKRAFEMLLVAHATHHAITDAIETGDGARAEMLFREHAHHQRTSMFERLEVQTPVL